MNDYGLTGIDAMVYSRYIVNLLQQDEPDPCPLSPPAFSPRRLSLTDCSAVAAARGKARARKVSSSYTLSH